jgi:hypothetical protein
MKITEITTEYFYNYLISLGLFRLTIRVDELSFTAQLSDAAKPNKDDFTQILRTPNENYPFYKVRLSKKDLFNDKITKGFFNQSSELLQSLAG